MDSHDDETLLRRYAQERDEAAFRELALRYGALVYSACFREVRRSDWAEDATQAVFLALARKSGRLRVKTSLVPWLYATARLECRGLLRAERRRQGREAPLNEEILAPAAASDDALFQALDALRASDREAVVLRFVQGLSLAEVGRTQGVSEDAARMRVQRALKRLRTEYVPVLTAPLGLVQRLATLTLPAPTPLMTAPVLLASGGLSALIVVGAATAAHRPLPPVATPTRAIAPVKVALGKPTPRSTKLQEPASVTPIVGPDARLDVRVSFTALHATYAELGAWVQKATGVPVYVVPAIRERKATVLVEDRPVRETMDRIAEALWLEWARTKEGYTLRLEPKASADEARYAQAEAGAWRNGLRQTLTTLADIGRIAPDRLQAEYDDANADANRLGKDDTPSGKAAAAAARERADRLRDALYVSGEDAAALLLASVTPERRDAILDGRPLFVSDLKGPNLSPLPPGLTAATKNMNLQADAPLVFGVEYLPATGELQIVHAQPTENGASGGWLPIKGDASPSYAAALADEPLTKRFQAFVASPDPKLLATPLAPKDPKPEPARPTPYRSLADALLTLHQRSGLPIVADGYRVALSSGRHTPDGTNVAAWIADLAFGAHGYRGPRPNVRAADGWLMFRQSQTWKQVGREVPEAPIRVLEAAYRRSGGATLDDYAAFAKGVTPAQEPFLGGADLVMAAPYQALEGNVPFLRLWAALPASLRRQALSPNGLALGPIAPNFGNLVVACVLKKLSIASASQAMLPYVLSNSPSLPETLRLNVSMGKVSSQDFPDMVSGEGYRYNPSDNRVSGVSAELRIPDAATFASYAVPLEPAVPIELKPIRRQP